MKLAIQVVKGGANGSDGGGHALTGAPIVQILLAGHGLLGAGAGLTTLARTRRRVTA